MFLPASLTLSQGAIFSLNKNTMENQRRPLGEKGVYFFRGKAASPNWNVYRKAPERENTKPPHAEALFSTKVTTMVVGSYRPVTGRLSASKVKAADQSGRCTLRGSSSKDSYTAAVRQSLLSLRILSSLPPPAVSGSPLSPKLSAAILSGASGERRRERPAHHRGGPELWQRQLDSPQKIGRKKKRDNQEKARKYAKGEISEVEAGRKLRVGRIGYEFRLLKTEVHFRTCLHKEMEMVLG
ncbi:hypothetical protein EYF80_031369 [Liparis tanakae]|uniref:Uncharacterized protein n=1 Tax=Liparis tanakae TaxID=230148 RepID=A0A4Z2GXU8_9TELE|nr:hypothetical protein EYF80_031369 [Liparis tanakae]